MPSAKDTTKWHPPEAGPGRRRARALAEGGGARDDRPRRGERRVLDRANAASAASRARERYGLTTRQISWRGVPFFLSAARTTKARRAAGRAAAAARTLAAPGATRAFAERNAEEWMTADMSCLVSSRLSVRALRVSFFAAECLTSCFFGSSCIEFATAIPYGKTKNSRNATWTTLPNVKRPGARIKNPRRENSEMREAHGSSVFSAQRKSSQAV